MFSGSKGGGSATFKQTPDNLRSTDTFEGVLGLCAGPIRGPKRGLKSIKLDGTPLENETGNLNFSDFVANFGNGDPAAFPQKVQLKLGAGGAPTNVGVTLRNPTTSLGTPGPWVTRTLQNTNADFIDFRFIVNQLYRQDKKGVFNNTATLEIQMKPVDSATWVNPTTSQPSGSYSEQGLATGNTKTLVPRKYFNELGQWVQGKPNYGITGKTTSPTAYELRIGVPNEGKYADTAWDVRIRLIEPESIENDPNFEKRTIQWESMSATYAGSLGDHEDWRGVAWMQLYGKASDQLTGVPEITGEYDTKIVSVPPTSVFNAESRTYTTSLWDGSWVKAFTTDPAWIINDAISDPLSGLSALAPGSYLNKWDALEVSKWCSVKVPDGNGGMHPRYSLNLAISEPQKAEEFIRYLAGAIGALAWDEGNGEWRMKVDKPDAAVDIFTLDNIEGEFFYANTDVDTRFNDIIGQFKNADMDYRQDSVRLFDNPSIAKIGRKPTTVALVGCTNRQEAMRRIKLRLRSTVNETRIVNFTTNRRGRNINQLDTILIADGDLGDTEKRTNGRIVNISEDRRTITLRDTVYIAPGVPYSIRFAVPNPGYVPDTTSQPITNDWTKPTLVRSIRTTNAGSNAGVTRTIYLAEALPSDIADNLAVALEATNLPTVPKLYRVTNVEIGDDDERIRITAIEIDTGKWDASDNVSKEDTVFQDLRGAVPVATPPLDGQLLSLVRVPVEQGSQVSLVANWGRPVGAYVSGFKVSYRINGGAWNTPQERTQFTTFEIIDPVPGLYEIQIQTLDRRGGVAEPLSGFMTVTQELIDATQIRYNGGETLEEMKPAQPGSDVTSENISKDTYNVGGRPSGQVLIDSDVTAETALLWGFNNQKLNDYVNGKLFVEGKPVNTVIVEETNQRVEGQLALAQKFDLIGVVNQSGTGVILNYDSLIVTEGKSLGLMLSELSSTSGSNSAKITQLFETVVTADGGAVAKALFQLDSNGHVVGYEATNDGTTGRLVFKFDAIEIQDPTSGAALFTARNGKVYMPNVEAGVISYESLVPKFGGQYSFYDENGGWEIMPSGIMRQWGRHKQNISSEITVNITFPRAFPTACTSVIATPWVANFTNLKDLWLMNVGTPTATGATFGTQAATRNDQSLDGFDWQAYGY